MRTWRSASGIVAVALVVLTTACSGPTGAGSNSLRASDPSPVPVIQVVAVGDSDATGVGDDTGRGWVGRYRALLQRRLGQRVAVQNLAAEGRTSDQLRGAVSSSPSLRKALAGADVILIGIGGADLNPGDDAWSAGTCKGRACYATILQTFDRNIAAVAKQARRLAPKALMLAMSLPNAYPGAADVIPRSAAAADASRYQVMTERASVCGAMRSNGGRCVDVVRAFNGAQADADAYSAGFMTKDPCCYPSGKGQQLIAQLLVDTGVPHAG